MSTRTVERFSKVGSGGPASRPARRRPPWWRRRLVKRSTIWVHRWLSLVLGLLLLAVTTSGAILVYEPEIQRWQHREAYLDPRPTGDAANRGEMALTETLDVARQHDPSFVANVLYDAHGTYVAESYEPARKVTVDPGTRQVLGDYDPSAEIGSIGWALGLIHNVHLCGLTCDDHPGYVPWLAAEVPASEWAGFEQAKITWGGLVLGVSAVMLLFLAVSGIWLWWPGVRHWVRGVRVRFTKGRYPRDYDLHQVAGMIAVPLLLVWAFTGAGYEFGFVSKAWYAALPGEDVESQFASKPSERPDAPDVAPAEAVAAGQRHAATTAPAISLDLPSAAEPTSTYVVWFADGLDPYKQFDYAGDYGIGVDRRTGETQVTFGGPGRPAATQLWNDWNFPTHSGYVVGPWWRLFWLVLGLVPLLLAVTGVSTWLWKRGVAKRRRALLRTRAAAAAGTRP